MRYMYSSGEIVLMKITVNRLRRIIKEEVQNVVREADALAAPKPPRGFLKVQLEGDPEFDAIPQAIAAILGKSVKALKSCTTEDDNGAYDRYIGKVQVDGPVDVPGLYGEASSGTLQGMPVVVTNEGGMASIYI